MDGCATVKVVAQKPGHGGARRWVDEPKASNCEAESDPLRFTGRQGAAGSKIERSGGRPPDDHLQTNTTSVDGARSRKAQIAPEDRRWLLRGGWRKGNRLELRGGKRSAKVYEVAESESRKALKAAVNA